ncbi:unnamed protein product [Ectocarpus fasciculatus]
MVVQATMNIGLGETLGSPVRAACVSFWVGLLFVSACNAAVVLLQIHGEATSRVPEIIDAPPQSPGLELSLPMTMLAADGEGAGQERVHNGTYVQYYHTGGLFGAFYILMTVIVIPLLGFSLFYVFLVAGQLLAALVIDLLPVTVFGQPQRPPSRTRFLGCGLAICHFRRSLANSISTWLMVVLAACSLLCGAALPCQAAINNVLRTKEQRSTFSAVRLSFSVGAASLSILSALSYIIIPPTYDEGSQNQWFEWCGGCIGILYLTAGVYFSPRIGYSVFFVCIICGQLGLSPISDMLGILGHA